MNYDKKNVGYTIALVSLAVKIVNFLIFFSNIVEWWKGELLVYFLLWFTHFVTIKSSKSRNSVSIPLSIIMIIVSVLFLLGDGLAFLGFVISLNTGLPMTVGITALCNILNLAANISILVECGTNKRVNRYVPTDEYVNYEEIPYSSTDEMIYKLHNMNSVNVTEEENSDSSSDEGLTFTKAREIFGDSDN